MTAQGDPRGFLVALAHKYVTKVAEDGDPSLIIVIRAKRCRRRTAYLDLHIQNIASSVCAVAQEVPPVTSATTGNASVFFAVRASYRRDA